MILFACTGLAQAGTDLSGSWGFTCADDHFQGWIVLHQSESESTFRGTWHTSKGKLEPDDEVTSRVDGDTVTLWRFIGNNRQSFVLSLSADGNRLGGFGDGYFLNHTNLNMQRSGVSAASPKTSASSVRKAPGDLSGLWAFTHVNDRFQGTIMLRQDGSQFTGVWHTTKGKTEPHDAVTGRIDGNTVTLWSFIGNERQYFTLILSADRTKLDGYGDG